MTLQPHTDADDWSFVEGPWQVDDQGVIVPPHNLGDENLAIYTGQTFGDFEAEYEFRWDSVWTDAGFIFRGKDARHYYLVQFPVVGQQYRAEHFWAAISKINGSGYVQVLNMQLVPGISSTPRLWHQARIKVQGNEFRLWVDGRPFPVVTDDTSNEPGYVGLYTHCSLGSGPRSSFKNLRIDGKTCTAPPWDDTIKPAHHYLPVDPDHGGGCGTIVRVSNGDLLITVGEGIRCSKDNGRTWPDVYPLPQGMNGLLRVARDGLLTMLAVDSAPPFVTKRATSQDDGKTWSKLEQTGEVKFPAEKPFTELYIGTLLTLHDGTLLAFGYARTHQERITVEARWYHQGPLPHYMNVCLRSADDGQSWSAPSNLDGPPYDEQCPLIAKDHTSEVSAAQTPDGKIIALVRPFGSPFMWESWSADGGATWTPQARGPFAMYGCERSMISTTSGYLIIGGRFPAMAVQVSRDSGMTWQCYQVDTAGWANGAMIEVEPDVVLFAYGGKNEPRTLRGQLMRITEDALEPLVVD